MHDSFTYYSNPWLPEDFGLKMTLFIGGSVIIIFLVNLFLRKIFQVKRRNFLKVHYFNDKHKKIDFYLSIAGGIVLIAILTYGLDKGPLFSIHTSLIVAFIGTLYKAYMEKKYAENPKEYLLTLLEFPLIVLFIFSLGSFLFPDIPLY